MEPISPLKCDHSPTLFVAASHRMGVGIDPERHEVLLCKRCGQFTVIGYKADKHFKITFELVTDEQLEAAGQWARLLEAELSSGDPEQG